MTVIEDEEIKSRKNKFEQAKKLGQAYPAFFDKQQTCVELLEIAGKKDLDELGNDSKVSGKKYSTAGRLMTIRPHGQIVFANLNDSTGKVQVVFTESGSGTEVWKK